MLVTGPGDVGDKLDAWRQVALYNLLELLPPSGRVSTRTSQELLDSRADRL